MSENVKTFKMVIDGKWVNSCDNDWINVENPANKTIFARVPRGKAADVDIAVAAAKKAFKTWSQTSAPERAKLLHAIANTVEQTLSIWQGQSAVKTEMPCEHKVGAKQT